MAEPQKSPIQLAQKPARFFNDKEEAFIKSVFSGDEGEKNLKIIRKALLPIYDVDGGVGTAIDFWTGENYENMLPDQQVLAVVSRVKFMNHIEKILLMLKSVANRVDETEQQRDERLGKDSTK